MGCSFGGWTADYFAASPDAAEPGQDVAIFVPMTAYWADHINMLFYINNIPARVVVQKSCKSRIDHMLGIRRALYAIELSNR
jgi:hypothetical protein